MSDPKMFVAAQGGPEQALIVQLVDMFRHVVASTCPSEDLAPEHNSYAMTAACMFAGSILGTMIYADLVTEAQAEAIIDSMTRNIRSGIGVGMRRATRVEREMGVGGQG